MIEFHKVVVVRVMGTTQNDFSGRRTHLCFGLLREVELAVQCGAARKRIGAKTESRPGLFDDERTVGTIDIRSLDSSSRVSIRVSTSVH